jgi:hypothetical protein
MPPLHSVVTQPRVVQCLTCAQMTDLLLSLSPDYNRDYIELVYDWSLVVE